MRTLITLLLMESQKIWNELKITIKNQATIILTLVFADAIGVVFVQQIFLVSYSAQMRDHFIHALESAGLNQKGLSLLLVFWLIFRIGKGTLLSPRLSSIFDRSDISVLFPSPADAKEIFLAKYMRRILFSSMRRIFVLSHFMFILSPIFLDLAHLLMLVFSGVIILEMGDIVEHIGFFLQPKISRKQPFTRKLFLPISIFAVTALIFLSSICLAQIFFLTLYEHRVSHLPVIGLIFGYSIMMATATSLVETRCYEKVDAVLNSQAKKRLRVFPKFFLEKNMRKMADPALMILVKNFISNFRQIDRFLGIAIAYLGLLVIYVLKNVSQGVPSPKVVYLDFFFITLIFLASTSIAFPTVLCFFQKRRTLYILRSGPISTDKIVMGEYLSSLTFSFVTILPIILSALVLFPEASVVMVTAFTIYFVLISNAIAIMMATYYPQFTRSIEFIPLRIFLFFVLTLVATGVIPYISHGLTHDPLLWHISIVLLSIYVYFVVRFCLKTGAEKLLICFYRALL